jgi:hypothetical protein
MVYGMVGSGGAIMSPRGTIKSSFAWGLGISTNNIAKSLNFIARLENIH